MKNALFHASGTILRVLALVVLAKCLPAQAYDLRLFNEGNGLGESYVYALSQDELGFLYVGTGSGIYRFDGAKFSFIDTTDGIAEDFTTAAFSDDKGLTWLGHYLGGITLLQHNQARRLEGTESIRSAIHSFAQDDSGNLWCASQKGVYRIDSTGIKARYEAEFKDLHAFSLAIGKVGRKEFCLVGTDMGLVVYLISNSKLQFRYRTTAIPETKVGAIVKAPNRSGFWLGTEDAGLIDYVPGITEEEANLRIFDAKAGRPELTAIQALLIDENRNLWVGTNIGLLHYRDVMGENIVPILPAQRADTLPSVNIRSLYMDKFGQVWAGTYGEGLLQISEKDLSTYRLKADSSSKTEMHCMLERKSGDFWIGTSKGLFLVDKLAIKASGDRFTQEGILAVVSKLRYGMADGLPSDDINAVLEDEDGNLWVGTADKGLAVLRHGSEEFEFHRLSSLNLSDRINGLVEDKQGRIWVGTSEGAYAITPYTGEHEYFGTQNKLPHNNIYQVFCDSDGKVWFLTHTNRIAYYDGKGIQNIEVTSHGETPNITCMSQTKDGILWLGSDGSGLYSYDGKRFTQFSKLEGLQSNYIYHIVVDHYNNVWTTHRDGLSRLIQQTGRILTYASKEYLQIEENPVHHATIDKNGDLWFSTEYGILRFAWHPSRNKTAAPFISITGVQVGDSIHPSVEDFSLPYGKHNLKFEFLGLTFLHQEDVMYQYRLNGGESNWSAPTKQDFVSFQDLPDGEYVFEVRACNLYGRCNESAAKIRFTIAPPFWKTWWFQILCVLAIIAVVVFYIRYREYRLKREKAILEEKVRRRTEELRAEKEKVEAANIELERLSLVASETDNAVFILDATGKVTWVNAGFSRLTGLNLNELLEIRGVNEDFLATSSDPEAKMRLKQAIESHASVQYESQLPTKEGRPLWVLSTVTPIFAKDGGLRSIVIIDSNITERKEAEEQVRKLNAELETLVEARTQALAEAMASLQVENEEHIKTAERLRVINAELDTFIYRASHDLKGPIASIMGLINIASMELAEEPTAQRYLGLMGKASKRLDGILIDLVEAVQVKQRTVENVDIEVPAMVKEIQDQVLQTTDATNAAFEYNLPEDLVIHTDQTLLRAILLNFMGNAIKYRDTKKEKAIAKIDITSDDRQWRIAVSDNGIGMPKEVLPRVFDMFYRGPAQNTGSGLGLYIVKQAVDKLGGTVTVESEPGLGTTFIVLLPRLA